MMNANTKRPNIALKSGALEQHRAMQGISDIPGRQWDTVGDSEQRGASIDRLLQFRDGVERLGKMLSGGRHLLGVVGQYGLAGEIGHLGRVDSGVWDQVQSLSALRNAALEQAASRRRRTSSTKLTGAQTSA